MATQSSTDPVVFDGPTLHTGDVHDDDPYATEFPTQDNAEPPPPPMQAINTQPNTPVLTPNRLLTGSQVLVPSWDKPTLLLPADKNRKNLTISVKGNNATLAAYGAIDTVAGGSVSLNAPYFSGFLMSLDVGAARVVGNLEIATGNLTFNVDVIENSGGGLVELEYWVPGPGLGLATTGTVTATFGATATAGTLKLTVFGNYGDSNFIYLADDPSKISMGGAGRVDECAPTEILPGYDGPVWVSAKDAKANVTVDYWAVTQ